MGRRSRPPSARDDRASSRAFGRHFLRPADASAFVERCGVRPGELVLDLGAGHGALTGPLLEAGARVVAVELDRRAVGVLHDRFGHAAGPGGPLTIVAGDLLAVPLPRRPYRVVANLPFAVTSEALRRLLDPRGGLRRADLVLQRAAAVRWATEPRHRSSGARRAFDVRLGEPIGRRAFVPPPKVDAATLVVARSNRAPRR